MSQNRIRIMLILGLIILVIIAIFIYTKNDEKENPTIELIGLKELTLHQHDQYLEPGYQIINTNNSNKYHVIVTGNVDTTIANTYHLTYSLYNSKSELINETYRIVIVLNEDNIDLQLNGESEETFFIDDYTDHGAMAYINGQDITNEVIAQNNVDASKVGTYEVKYKITHNNQNKEITRKVNIVDYDIQLNLIDKSTLNITINCKDYYYTLLPDKTKSYTYSINYPFVKNNNYEFDIYLKSGSHKKYLADLSKFDFDGPTGSCTIYHNNGKTVINMNTKDTSKIKKYVFNGIQFHTNTITVGGLLTGITVRAYDEQDNYTDFKCSSQYGTVFRTFNLNNNGYIEGKKGFISCNSNVTAANNELNKLIQSYGLKTRGAVAMAGVYLADYEYKIPYFWAGKYVKKGLNPSWGCRSRTSDGNKCSKSLGNDYCELGLDCTGFTSWAFAQAGFDYSIIRQDKQSEGMWGNFNALKHRYAFNSSNRGMANLIKPGDIVHKPNHVGLVIGVSDELVQVAEMTGPIVIDVIRKSDGKSTNGRSNFEDFVLFDDFYKMYGK